MISLNVIFISFITFFWYATRFYGFK
jgi:hypothetical protein